MMDGTTASANNLPPYLDMVFASIDSDGYGEADSIVLFTSSPTHSTPGVVVNNLSRE
jgi:hypothetical protein